MYIHKKECFDAGKEGEGREEMERREEREEKEGKGRKGRNVREWRKGNKEGREGRKPRKFSIHQYLLCERGEEEKSIHFILIQTDRWIYNKGVKKK